ncbi:hypothetical protein NQ317_015755 [Molorchus minor]|uniref:TIR domain-containing protein n=1 Tax=Molorchus minor TaxID=1323400 RepID=A0ABQ9K2U8_9CUCU|nr:hypothetical protein NQ317_015755 [Molorchus minor]
MILLQRIPESCVLPPRNMLLPSLLSTILIISIREITTFEPCDGDYCPPAVVRPKASPIEINQPAPVLLGTDAESGCICREHPKVFVVCFGRLLCKKVPLGFNITAPTLKVTITNIYELRPGAFAGLTQLEGLQIDGNLNLSKILPGAFNSNLTKLTNMSISFNPNLRILHPLSFQGLVNLRTLYIVKNGFETVYDIAISLSPPIVPNLYKISLNENNFDGISSEDFVPMENSTVEDMSLVLCRLDYLHPDCFAPLKKLEVLRLGENSFNSSTISDVIARTVEIGIPLKLLNLYSVGFRKSPPRKLMEALAKSNITNLNLAGNQFEIFFPYMPNIKVLDLRSVLALEIQNDAFKNLPNLKTLLLGGNKLATIPEGVILNNLTYLDLQQNSVNRYYQSYFSIPICKFASMNKLVYLNLNFNRINHLENKTFVGLGNLQTLGLRNSTIFYIQNDTFVPLKNLLFLNIENNYFISNKYPPGIDVDVFKGLGNLRVLLLGGCGITSLSKNGNPFKHLKSLEHLGLEKNSLKTISATDFSPLARLKSIDLSENLLVVWDERIFRHNPKLQFSILNRNKISYFSGAMLDDFSNLTQLEVQYNPFFCDCRSYKIYRQWFFHAARKKNVEINAHCVFPETMNNYSVTVSFCYYYRWHIRYWIFLTRLYLSRKGKIKPKSEKTVYTNYIYDAFVSYSNEDRNFVVRLVTMLENYDPFLKLCVYERDFQIGTMISESVLESVAQSRRTLLIISDNYAKSQWCRWESQIAEHHRLFFENENGEYVDDSLVLIKLGPVGDNHLTPTLKYLLKTRIYLPWEADEKKQKVFWERLRTALAPPKNDQGVSECTHI